MTRGYFVTGTDTGVGKTFATTAVARLATERGQRVLAFKPIETGVPPADSGGVRLGEDQRALVAASGGWQTGELRGLYQFDLPAAPLVSAEAEGRSIDFDEIDRVLAAGRAGTDLVLVEGAGGWRVPIWDGVDMGGFAKRLGLPVLVVARAGLGTINHSLLTVVAVDRQGCSVAAVVLSVKPDDDLDFARSNAEQISRVWPGRVVLFTVPSDLEVLL
jgi:dethiobiotin synthetase